MRVAAKRDATEPAIVKALELAGWTVVKVSDGGFPDLVCCRRGVVRFLECKSPGGSLTPKQEKCFPRIEAAGVKIHIVTTPAEALAAVAQGVEGVLPPLRERLANPSVMQALGHVVTPAFRREQTESVVPKRRKK